MRKTMYVRFGSKISEQQIINRFKIGPEPLVKLKVPKMSPEKLEEFKRRWMSMMRDIKWRVPIISTGGTEINIHRGS